MRNPLIEISLAFFAVMLAGALVFVIGYTGYEYFAEAYGPGAGRGFVGFWMLAVMVAITEGLRQNIVEKG